MAGQLLRAVQTSKEIDLELNLEQLFGTLRDYWHPAHPSLDQQRCMHVDQYDALLDLVMREPALSFIDDAFFPSGANKDDRARLFVGARMLDLMQRVYIDLDLDNNRDHPHNAGWIEIFGRWKCHPAVAQAWEASKGDYSCVPAERGIGATPILTAPLPTKGEARAGHISGTCA